MGTIRTSIQMFNGMTPGLRSMTNALNITISSFEAMQRASSNSIDTSSLQAARAELNRAEVAFNQIETSISQADQQQQRLNNDMRSGTGIANSLRSMLAGIGGLMGLKKVVEISDEFSRSTARLSLMAGGMENVKGIQEDIYQSAQRTRTSYLGTMDAVAKLGLRAGDVFKNTRETIAFVEQLNKQFKIAGASQAEISSATLQLTQALGSGVLRGEEFNAVFEAAPNVMQSVADYMDVPIGKLREMAGDGMITADIVKNAMFAAVDKTNEQFKQIPNTWADVWTMTENKVIMLSQPLLKFIGVLANNWSIIEPIILGVVTALGLYFIATKGVAAAQIAFSAVQTFLSIGFGILTGNTAAASAAMFTYNSALLASPITWIILAVIALIAIFYAVIAVINKVKGTTYNATSFVVGAFYVAGAAIYNTVVGFINAAIQFIWGGFAEPVIGIIEWVLNAANGGFNSFGDAVANLIGQIISWFLSLGKVVTKIIDAIFGTNWTGGLNSLQSSVLAWGKNENAITIDRTAPAIKSRIEYGDAWEKGKAKGLEISDKISGVFEGSNMDNLLQNTEDIASNTGGISDSLDISKEDLKYMRDVAEREAINRYTTAQIAVDFKNTATINSNMDIDGVMNKFTEKLREAVDTSAEAVHYVV